MMASNWAEVGIVNGTSQSANNYSFIDFTPAGYYRIKQVDINGATSYSEIVAIAINTISVNVYPNPATDFLYIESLEVVNVVITDMNGNTINSFSGTSIQIDVSSMRAGVYMIYITTENETKTEKIVIR